MDDSIAAYVRSLPKVELHVHLEGSIRPSTLFDLARRNSVTLPAESVLELERWLEHMRAGAFFSLFGTICRCMRSAEDFERVTCELGEDLARQNVRHAEVHFNVAYQAMSGLDFDTYFTGLARGRSMVRDKLGVSLAWIFPIVRGLGPDAATRARAADYSVAAAIDGRADGVVALGLGGREQDGDVGAYVDHFDRARAAGLGAVPHAGEFAGAANVAASIDLLGARRIGHGIRCLEDPRLVERVAAEQICLDVCPTSNVRLGLVNSLRDHPIRELVARGVQVSVNTDDPRLFATDLNGELTSAADNLGWREEEIETSQRVAIRHALLPETERRALDTELTAASARLRSR